MTAPRILATDYDVYEVAYLAGGPRRAVDTAVVALVESGRVRVARPSGELSVLAHQRRHPVEAAVLDVLGRRGEWSIDTVRSRLKSDQRLRALGQRLEDDGLVSRAASRSPVRVGRWQLLSLTGEGRRTLRYLRSDPPPDRVAGETSAMAVALAGTGQMADRDVHARVFEPPRRAWGRADAHDPYSAAYGPTSYGLFGGGFDGGGFCGDGGGGGGGDGGGC